MKRIEWMCAGALSAALLLGAGCQGAQAKAPEQAPSAQATGGSGAAGQQGERTVTYKLTGRLPDQPTAELKLTFAPGDKKVSGTGSIQAKDSQPVKTEIQGDVTRTPGIDHPDRVSTTVVATGHLPSTDSTPRGPHGGSSSAPENFKLQVVVYPDGASGLGLFQYRPEGGDKWIDVKPVTLARVDAP